jgi:hypothetical protein
VEYIHRNPVAANLVKEPQKYRFSSAHPNVLTDMKAFFGG